MRTFYDQGAKQLGVAPDEFRRGASETEIGFTTGSCAVGRFLVAATSRGVCAIRLGAHDSELIEDLRQDFPEATIERNDHALGFLSELIQQLASGRPAASSDIPLDLQGTTFQATVWEELRSLAPGTTATYGEIAARIGRPTAARAVANACASNPIALVVPCHRVVRGDGAMGGYRWGVERKQSLLSAENPKSSRTV